jgi:hypothetical protein
MELENEIFIKSIHTARGTNYRIGTIHAETKLSITRIESRIRQFEWSYRVHLSNGEWIEVLDVVEIDWAVAPGKVD